MQDRWAELEAVQKEYASFTRFCFVCMTSLLGFTCTWMQLAIAAFLQFGPLYRMIQAQRGEAKTTITAMYAVWRLIHNPRARIVIVSSTEKMAKEIGGWIIQILKGMPELECMLPDTAAGDRASVISFDVHNELKGAEKSPSIKVLTITGSMSGTRADILIADDIETPQNSMTEHQREHLRFLTKEFTSICSTGDIIYLGTPQSVDSVYNSLPSRGYTIRIWPGRFPTQKEQENYGDMLCPIIVQRMLDNPDLRTGGGPTLDRGKPTDPDMLNEEVLTKKEIDQGPAYFQLQHMLDTRLSDMDRFPLKPEKLIFLRPNPGVAPAVVTCIASENNRLLLPSGFPLNPRLYLASGASGETIQWQGTHFYIDPAGGGQNGDESAWACTKMAAGYIWLVGVGGVPGGTDESSLDAMVELIQRFKPNTLGIEKNFGHGMYASVLLPRLLRKHKCSLTEPWNGKQKETRIIAALEPLLGAGRLIVDPDIVAQDWASVQHYPAAMRSSYSFIYQLMRLTREKGSLLHDDRLDAVAGACEHWQEQVKQDELKAQAAAKVTDWNKRFNNPLGEGVKIKGFGSTGRPSYTTTRMRIYQ